MSDDFEQEKKRVDGLVNRFSARTEEYKQKIDGLNEGDKDYQLKKQVFQKMFKDSAKRERQLIKQRAFLRPEIPEDVSERLRIRQTYPTLIKDLVPDDHPLCFHGVKDHDLLEDILSSGHLGYLENETSNSFAAPGALDVTTKDSISVTIKGFTGLSCSGSEKYAPAGFLFVVLPKDEAEANECKVGGEASILTVDFKKEPDRLVAIVSTRENVARMREAAAKYGIYESKIFHFDAFIEHLQKEKHKDTNTHSAVTDKIALINKFRGLDTGKPHELTDTKNTPLKTALVAHSKFER